MTFFALQHNDVCMRDFGVKGKVFINVGKSALNEQ